MWLKLDNGFACHPKVVAAGPLALAIQVRAFCYASQHLTDGFIPLGILASLTAGMERIGIETATIGEYAAMGLDADEVDWPALMIEHGLWEPRDGGYYIHDYLDWNPSKKEINRIKNKQSSGGKKGMKRRWGKDLKSDNVTYNSSNKSTCKSPSISISTLNPLNSSESDPKIRSNGHTSAKGKTPFPLEWVCNDKMMTMAAGFGLQGAAEFQAFKDHALMHDRRLHDWMAGYRSWIRKGKAMKEAR